MNYKICDFGLSYFNNEEKKNITKGSIIYMSPE